MNPVRCATCHKIIVEHLDGGLLLATCPRCKSKVVVDRTLLSISK